MGWERGLQENKKGCVHNPDGETCYEVSTKKSRIRHEDSVKIYLRKAGYEDKSWKHINLIVKYFQILSSVLLMDYVL
jgi:hypothetical protein